MSGAETTPHCRPARAWLSAHRDGEALDDATARAHVDACGACAAWAGTLDVVSRRTAVRSAGSPDVAAAAIGAYRARQVARPRERQARWARLLLGGAGAAGLLLAVLGLTGAFGTPAGEAGHLGRELYAFEAALALGFALAAWRPLRYAASLLPITAVVILVAVLPSAGDLSRPGVDPLAEVSHLPVLVGLVALLLLSDARRDRRADALRTRPA